MSSRDSNSENLPTEKPFRPCDRDLLPENLFSYRFRRRHSYPLAGTLLSYRVFVLRPTVWPSPRICVYQRHFHDFVSLTHRLLNWANHVRQRYLLGNLQGRRSHKSVTTNSTASPPFDPLPTVLTRTGNPAIGR